MPELPEVETVRRGLNRVTCHQAIQGGQVLLPRSIAYPDSAEQFLRGINQTQILQWQRRGKYLLAQLVGPAGASAGWLGVHLRMTGQLLWLPATEPVTKHCRVRLTVGERELRFVDQRTFGRLWWVPPDQLPEHIMTGLTRLGPEPFADAFSPAYLYKATRHRARPIKNALLDQRLVAGIGNIYADESLFISGIRPNTPSGRLGRSRLTQLHSAVQQVLTASIEAGGTTFSDFRDVHGVNGNYGGVAWVYDRAGEPCRTCQTPIQRIKLAGRSSHYCPNCQH
ncbi:MAG: DNA-formamidopyrimidine glycosylase [Leptolyngbya sp. RL_3_1]|nr:DNA-formamidopyrimidine glycosylase [Leptolyngbya sp. RL_3_1]